jgi:S-layer family protein
VDISGNVFYTAIHYLNCGGVVNGLDAIHYEPSGTSTRGQFAKVVVLGFGIASYTPATPDFSDVPASYYAYAYIETGYQQGILSGFDANTCQANGQPFPCYLPGQAITRGQLTKLVVNAAGYALYTPSGGTQTFSDVPPSNIFYVSIETAHNQGVINGYPDQTFRPNLSIRRDEMAQIVYKGVTTP